MIPQVIPLGRRMVAERSRNGRSVQAAKTSPQGLHAILTALRAATFSLMLKSAVLPRTPGLSRPVRDADHQSVLSNTRSQTQASKVANRNAKQFRTLAAACRQPSSSRLSRLSILWVESHRRKKLYVFWNNSISKTGFIAGIATNSLKRGLSCHESGRHLLQNHIDSLRSSKMRRHQCWRVIRTPLIPKFGTL